MHRFFLPFLLIACHSEDKGTVGQIDDSGAPADDSGQPDTGDTHDSTPPCAATVVSSFPEDGATDVALDAVPSVVLSEADPTALLESDIPGTFTVSDDGLTLTWVADEALDPDTTYTVSTTTCASSDSFSFTTIALETPDFLVDRSWELDLSGGTITEPALLESLLGDSLVPALLGVSAASPGKVDMRVAAYDDSGGSVHQDYCLATSDVDGATYDDGKVHGYADEVWVTLVAGDPVPVYQLDFSGEWSDDGTRFSNGVLQGALDARYVSDWLSMSADALCGLAEGLGFPCSECPDGEVYCVGMRIEDLAGTEIPTTLIEVTGSDCPGCDVGEPVCE